MFSFEVDEFHVVPGQTDSVRIEVEGMTGEAGLECLEGMINDTVLEIEDVFDVLYVHSSFEEIVDLVVKRERTEVVLDQLDEDDVVDYVMDNIEVTTLLAKILDKVKFEDFDEEVLRLKKKIERRRASK